MRISDWSSDVCSSDLFPVGYKTTGARDHRDQGGIIVGLHAAVERQFGKARSDHGIGDAVAAHPVDATAFAQTGEGGGLGLVEGIDIGDRKSTRLNSSH